MKKVILSIIILTASLCAVMAAGRKFVHPGLLHNAEDLARIEQLVKDKAQPSMGSYEILARQAGASYDYKVNGPFVHMARDGEYGSVKARGEADCNAAYYNALQWCITRDERHARKAMEILRGYASTIEDISGHDAPLCAGLQGFMLINAAEIMRYQYVAPKYADGWTADDTQKVEAMFRNVFLPVLRGHLDRPPYSNGNWGGSVAKMLLAMGIFCNDEALYDEAVDYFLHSKDNGSLPNYVGPTGQQQETGRDQAHAQLGLGVLAELCECAWKQGDDLYATLDNRLMKGYEYLAKLNLGYDVPYEVWKDATGKYSNWMEPGKKGMGEFRSVFEIAFNHYTMRKGLKMPYVAEVLQRIRPEWQGWTCDNPGFGTLLFYLGSELPVRKEVLASPDSSYVMTVSEEQGLLKYRVDWNGQPVVLSSKLGIKANIDWQKGIRIESVKQKTVDETWTPVYGERSRVRNNYNEYRLTLGLLNRRDKLVLEVRMYDEGVAFRYAFGGGNYLHITDEYTDFQMPEGTMAWHTERAQTVYNRLPLEGWKSESDRPLILDLPDGRVACLAEAAVVNYCRTKFMVREKNIISTSMYGDVDEVAPFSTPWRMVMCAENNAELLSHNDLFLNLNEPCAIADPSWIKPGKMMRETTLTTEGALAVVDFLAAHNMKYMLFDTGWYGPEGDKRSDARRVSIDPKRNKDPHALDMKRVVEYAKEKGIGVVLYVNQRALQQQLDEILPIYKEWGIAGLKFGFVQVGSHTWTKWMHEAVMKCAEYGLMVDIHDEYRPTGFSRTYPNLMTQEGIRGNEEFPDATHNVTLPFTRYMCGAADYTICYFSNRLKTTHAHQLAMSVVYYSPLQVIYWYDKPRDIHDEPELKFFDDVYTVWDDTRILDGKIGEHVTVARRHADEWFVGMMTNNDGRELSLSLSFLDKGKDYIAEIYEDGDESIATKTKVSVSQKKVKSKDVLKFALKPSGGVAIRLVPVVRDVQASTKTQTEAEGFSLSDVRLTESRFRENMQRDSAWMCSLPTARLLHSFRNNAGVFSALEGGYDQTKVQRLGGWESLDCDLRGHTTGHLMSAFSQMYASTDSEIFKLKGDSLVAGLHEVQLALGSGYLSAFPENLINRNLEGKSVWAPWYTLHKILAGLIDQYSLAGNREALMVAEGMGNWAYGKLRNVSEETRQLMIRNEFGGINEAFYNLYAITGNEKYNWLAEFFYHNDKIDPLKAHNGEMGTLHTNTFIPKVIAEARNYEISGSEESRDLCEFFWHQMIDNHVLAPGCVSDKEHFFDPNQTSKHLSGYTGETCCTYNMLKLTRHLFEWNPKAEYMDYYEQALYNQILGQQDPESGMVCYFIPTLSGAHKVYSTYDRSFWCCVGSGFENHAKYGESIYFHSADNKSLFVNLFIPSQLNWREKGVKIEQQTSFPKSEQTVLTVETEASVSFAMRIRKPSWCEKVAIKVNGKAQSVKVGKDGYLCIERNWKNGDRVEVSLPMTLRMEATRDDASRTAVFYGPILLAGELGTEGMQSPAPFSNPDVRNDYYTYDFKVPAGLPTELQVDKQQNPLLTPIDGSPLCFKNNNGVRVSPLYDIHRQRYVIYWDKK